MSHFRYHLFSSLALFFILTNHSVAQPIPVLPGSVQPSVVGEALSTQQKAHRKPAGAPEILTTPTAPSKAMEEAKKITFKLKRIILTGNHVFTQQQLQVFYQKDLNKVIPVSELFIIEQNITNFYRDNGYILTRAILPPQEVTNGEVHIQILEGFIANVTVAGTPYESRCMVQRFGNKIRLSNPLQLKEMEKYLLLANEIPGTTVKAQLSPAKAMSKASDLTLITQNRPITAYFSYDNYGTLYIGPQQMTGNITLNSLLLSGDAVTTTMTKTPKGGELTYNDLNYNFPWNDEGGRWTLGVTRVTTHPLFVLGPVDIDSLNPNYYTYIYFPTIRTQTESLTWRLGFNYLDTWTTSFGQMLYADHLRPIDLGGTWTFADKYQGSNVISGDIRLGLPIFGYTSDTNPNTAHTSRPGGRGKFAKVSTLLSRTQLIHGPWSLYGLVQGQWGFVPLLTEEQYSYGGPQIGRGYDPGEMLGDRAVAGSFELRYDTSFTSLAKLLRYAQFYAYYDGGIIWNIITAGGIQQKNSATSTGAGIRFGITQYVTGNFMWTQVLTKKIVAESLRGQGFNSRVFFSLQFSV